MQNDIDWGRTPDFLAAQLRTAQMGIYKHFAEWFADTELSAKQFGVLYVISLNPGINQRRLANVEATRRTSMGETLMRLEEKGFVTRKPALDDKRSKAVSITAAGQKVLDRVLKGISRQEREFSAILSESERHTLIALLLKINQEVLRQSPKA